MIANFHKVSNYNYLGETEKYFTTYSVVASNNSRQWSCGSSILQ